MHAVELTEWGQTAENPGEFRVPNDVGLNENCTALGIKTTRNVLGNTIECPVAKIRRNLRNRNRMLVRYEKITGIPIEHLLPIVGGSKKIAEMK